MYPTPDYREYDADVIIIGGGISGMSAAFYILEYEPTMKVLILEANDHIGGRTFSLPLKINEQEDLKTFDFGGQFISASQIHLKYLVNRLELKLLKVPIQQGKTVWNLQEKEITKTWDHGFILPNINERMEFDDFCSKIKKLSEQVSFDNPYGSELSLKYDEESMESFIKRKLHLSNTRRFVRIAIKIACGVEASEISVLFYLTLYNSTGGQVVPSQDFWIQGGADQICQKIASRIGRQYVKLNERVIEVMNNNFTVVIETEENIFRSKFVIVAIPPKEVLQIAFTPALSTGHTNLLKEFKTGHIIKFVATYQKEFWKNKSLNGCIFSCGRQGGHGPISSCLNLSSKTYFALSGCIAASDCRDYSHKNEVLQQLAHYLGPEALYPLDYYEKSWSAKPYINGSVMNNTGVGNMSNYAQIMQPIGRLYWAGTETAVLWNGHMGGAVQAGYRAAVEMLYDYRPQSLQYTDIAFIKPEENHILGQPSSYTSCAEDKLLPVLKSSLTIPDHKITTGNQQLLFGPREERELAPLSVNPEEQHGRAQPGGSPHYRVTILLVSLAAAVSLGFVYYKKRNIS